jgi:hypothetical protein
LGLKLIDRDQIDCLSVAVSLNACRSLLGGKMSPEALDGMSGTLLRAAFLLGRTKLNSICGAPHSTALSH